MIYYAGKNQLYSLLRQVSGSLRFRWTDLDATVLQGEIQFHVQGDGVMV